MAVVVSVRGFDRRIRSAGSTTGFGRGIRLTDSAGGFGRRIERLGVGSTSGFDRGIRSRDSTGGFGRGSLLPVSIGMGRLDGEARKARQYRLRIGIRDGPTERSRQTGTQGKFKATETDQRKVRGRLKPKENSRQSHGKFTATSRQGKPTGQHSRQGKLTRQTIRSSLY